MLKISTNNDLCNFLFSHDKIIIYLQLDANKTLFEQSGDLPYDFDFEFPRNRLRFVRVLGSGAFGEVAEHQAFQIGQLQPRNKLLAAQNKRKKIWSIKNVAKQIDKYLNGGNRLEIVAVKVLKGNNYKFFFHLLFNNFIYIYN